MPTSAGTDTTSEAGSSITFTMTLTRPPAATLSLHDALPIFANGETVTIAAGQTVGSTTIAVNQDDVYLEPGAVITNSIASVSAGGTEYEALAIKLGRA